MIFNEEKFSRFSCFNLSCVCCCEGKGAGVDSFEPWHTPKVDIRHPVCWGGGNGKGRVGGAWSSKGNPRVGINMGGECDIWTPPALKCDRNADGQRRVMVGAIRKRDNLWRVIAWPIQFRRLNVFFLHCGFHSWKGINLCLFYLFPGTLGKSERLKIGMLTWFAIFNW